MNLAWLDLIWLKLTGILLKPNAILLIRFFLCYQFHYKLANVTKNIESQLSKSVQNEICWSLNFASSKFFFKTFIATIIRNTPTQILCLILVIQHCMSQLFCFFFSVLWLGAKLIPLNFYHIVLNVLWKQNLLSNTPFRKSEYDYHYWQGTDLQDFSHCLNCWKFKNSFQINPPTNTTPLDNPTTPFRCQLPPKENVP